MQNTIELAELPGSDPLVSSDVVRREFGISSPTLYRRIKCGEIPEPDATVNNQRMWLWSTILRAKAEFLAKCG